MAKSTHIIETMGKKWQNLPIEKAYRKKMGTFFGKSLKG